MALEDIIVAAQTDLRANPGPCAGLRLTPRGWQKPLADPQDGFASARLHSAYVHVDSGYPTGGKSLLELTGLHRCESS
jgi:hypothetical protein